MALNIPTPDLPGNALMKGLNTGSTLFSRYMEPILQRQRMAQQQQQFGANLGQRQSEQQQAEQHFLQELALRKQQEARLAQASAMQQQMAKYQLQKLMRESDPMKQLEYIQKIESGLANMPFNQGQQSQNPMQPFSGGGMSSPQEMARQSIAPPSQEQIQQGFLSPQQRREIALNAAGIKIPKITETPQQKRAADAQSKLDVDEIKATRKKIDEIEKTAQALLPYVGKVNTIEDILKRKPELAGRTTQLADLLGMTKDEDVGTFLSSAQALQAHMAKEMSSRGGYGVAKLVEQAKPNIGKSTAYNKGVIKELKQSMKDSFTQMKQEYERLSGKKFPYNFEQYFQEQTGVSTTGSDKKSSGSRLKFNPSTGRLE